MKKIIAFVMAVMLTCTFPIVAFAEEEPLETVVPEETVVEEESLQTMVDQVVDFAEEHLDAISVVITLILSVFYQMRKHKALNKSIGTLNNNAVTVAEDSSKAVTDALASMEGVSSVVGGYKEQIETLLAKFQATAEEKQSFEQTLAEVQNFLKTAKLANMELANEVAELLVLANIPNSKKEELYARHLAAVGAIADAEKTEVITDVDGQETE